MTDNTVEMMLAQVAAEEELKRLARYQAAWKRYNGEWPAPLRRRGAYDDNVTANKARVIVDKGASFLFGQEVGFEIATDGEEGPDQTPEEKFLDGVWWANRKGTLLQKAALDGGVCGHVFMKIRSAGPGEAFPRIILLDPAIVSVRWEEEDIDRVYSYRIQWSAISRETGKPIARRQRIDQDGAVWRIVDEVSQADSLRWQVTSEETWPYPWAPVVDCQNLPLPGSYYGASDLEEDILSLISARNFNLSNWNRINRFHAAPQTWGKGFSAQQMERDATGVWIMPSAEAELHNLEMGNPMGSTSELDRRLDEAIHEISGIPPIATGKLESIGQISGVALQILFAPLIEKTRTKRALYGTMLGELNRRLLALGGFGEEHRVENIWPEMLPWDPRQEAETLLLHQQLGVSKQTALDKLGYDSESEQEKRQQEGEEAAEQMMRTFDRGEGAERSYPGSRTAEPNGRERK